MTEYIKSQCEQTIKDFSFFVADADTTRYFAIKASIVYYNKLTEVVDKDYSEQLKYLKSLL